MVVVATKWAPGSTSTLYKTYMSNKYGDLFSNNCRSIDTKPFKSCYWTNSWKLPLYITKSCYESLTDEQKGYARAGGVGMVKDSGYFTFVRVEQYGNRYKFNPDSILPYPTDDPCKDVSCPDKCVGVDKYDQVCQDGICVRGSLIEYNSEHCGYETPSPNPEPIPGDEDGDHVITPPQDNEYIQYGIAIGALIAAYLILR